MSPVIIPFKVLFQQIYGLKINWDYPSPDEFTNQWKTLINEMSQNTEIEVPRFLVQ